MKTIGIDIGTTTISMVFMDSVSHCLIDRVTVPHDSFIPGLPAFHKCQAPDVMLDIVNERLKDMIMAHGTPDAIGFTGQMHGILYVDHNGKAVSPLYTWQDGCGDETQADGNTAVSVLRAHGCEAATGYGLSTHLYLQRAGKIPERAEYMMTVSDWIAARLCTDFRSSIGVQMAASWGAFDTEKLCFRKGQLIEAGVNLSYLPEITDGKIGKTGEGVPVFISLGDNQASVLGALNGIEDGVLLNIGTGSQVSMISDAFVPVIADVEIRPFTNGRYLLVGAGLCGGRAYAMLQEFYRHAAASNGEVYDRMESEAREFLKRYGKNAVWKIDTAFSGTRSDPGKRGCITGIGTDNFTPGAMTAGMLYGMLEELHSYYRSMCESVPVSPKRLVVSGNGMRKNRLLRELAGEVFGMTPELSAYLEEAACGAAMYAAEQLDMFEQ